MCNHMQNADKLAQLIIAWLVEYCHPLNFGYSQISKTSHGSHAFACDNIFMMVLLLFFQFVLI